MFVLLWAVAAVAAWPSRARADEASVELTVTPEPGRVLVSLVNAGRAVARDVGVDVELASRRYRPQGVVQLGPREQWQTTVETGAPPMPGSYAVVTRVTYETGGRRMSVVNAAYLDHGEPGRLPTHTSMRAIRMHQRGSVTLRYDKRLAASLVLPEEVRVTSRRELGDGQRWWLANPDPTRVLGYSMFAVLEAEEGGRHHVHIVYGRLHGVEVFKAGALIRPWMLAVLGVLGLCVSFAAYRGRGRGKIGPARVAFVRYGFSVFTVSLLLWLFHNLYVVPDWFLTHFAPGDFGRSTAGRAAWRVLDTLTGWLYFEGGDYDLFSRHVLDPLYLYVLMGNYFVLRWVIKPKPRRDKYWHLLRSLFSLATLVTGERRLHWSKKAKVAVLTLCVKIFYVPLVCSWTINNVFHQQHLWRGFSWTWLQVHTFVVAALIFVDVAIFTFGYLVELPQLDNEIRSVEPTLLGWVVCLMCYPPFNRFSFAPFDITLLKQWAPWPGFWRYFALSLVAIMWFFYCWATVALGPRSSNLTNRGIVRRGPYAYVRHPAYASKVFLWAVGTFFLAERSFFMTLGLVLVYALRAWTEERHLSQDPDYLTYKQEVPYRFIPWLI